MKQLRVLHCRQGDQVWGPERQILQLAEWMPRLGISMEIVLLRRWGLDSSPHPLAARARELGCPVHEVPARPGDWPGVVRLLRQRLGECDLLHTHEFKSDLLGYVATRLSSRPWIATDHHLAADEDFMLRAFAYADRWALQRTQAVVVPSYSQASILSRHIAPDRIHVIHHGIDAEAFAHSAEPRRGELRHRLGVSDSQPVVSIIGRLDPIKGHSVFLETARLLLDQRPEIQFWVIGDGKLRKRLDAHSAGLGLTDAVKFWGYQNDIAPWIAASDVIVMPSFHESFGIVLIEAMSLAKPIVASAAGGIPEVVLDGHNGYLATPGDPRQLSERVLQMLSNPAAAVQLGLAGKDRVSKYFTTEQMALCMADLYRSILAGEASRQIPTVSRNSASVSLP
ncbi:MAG: glycosyltransferase family 4 protein [Caldilineales bacterium]|nr:glycosyltransferase family 4 protein [Caldilineales bacterium]